MPTKLRLYVKQPTVSPTSKAPRGYLPSPGTSNDDNPFRCTVEPEREFERNLRKAGVWHIPGYEGSSAPEAAAIAPKATVSVPAKGPKARAHAKEQPKPIVQLLHRVYKKKPKPVRRINCRAKIPGTSLTMYTYQGKIYHCPPQVKPWHSDERWKLDPQRNLFMRFASRVPNVDHDVYHYYSNQAFSPCPQQM